MIWPAWIRNAKILVLDLVELMLNVVLSVIHPCVFAPAIIVAILSYNVYLDHVRFKIYFPFFFNLSIIIKDFRFSLSFKLCSNFDLKIDVEQLKSLIIITQFNNFFPWIILLFVLQLSSYPWKSFSMYPISMRVQCDMQRTKWCRLVLLFIRLYW